MATETTGKISGTLALGLTFDTSDTRKFALDVTALTKVTCEMVSVPPPRQLMALADKWAGVTTTTTTPPPTTTPPTTTPPTTTPPK